jgi:hypothetical protein
MFSIHAARAAAGPLILGLDDSEQVYGLCSPYCAISGGDMPGSEIILTS